MAEYKNLTFKAALALARTLSGLNNEEIAERSRIHHSTVARYFSEHDPYYPPAHQFRNLCQALGNTVIFDWVESQRSESSPEEKIRETPAVSEAVREINRQVLALNDTALDAIADGILSGPERARLAHDLRLMVANAATIADRLSGS